MTLIAPNVIDCIDKKRAVYRPFCPFIGGFDHIPVQFSFKQGQTVKIKQ